MTELRHCYELLETESGHSHVCLRRPGHADPHICGKAILPEAAPCHFEWETP